MDTRASVKRMFAICFAAAIMALPIQAAAAKPAAAAQTQQQAEAAIKVYIDGKAVTFTPAPVQKNGTTLVPMRPAFDALGAKVTWEQSTKTIFAQKDGTNITLQLGSSSAVINGRKVKLDAPAQTINGATMVPIRFVSEALDAKVAWEQSTRTIRITSAEYRAEQEAQAAAAAAAARQKLTPAEIVEMNDGRVVMITTDSGQGSGVVVGDRWVLTNYHVLTGSTEGAAHLSDGTSVKITGVAAADEDADLAIVQTSRSLFIDPVEFSSLSSVRKGDKVVAIGSPLGYQNTVSEGLISNMIFEGGVRYYQINTPIDHGSSGGALFNEFGELVGITTSGVQDTSADLNFAVSSIYGELLLSDLEFDPPSASEIKFPPSSLPDSLAGESDETIRKLLAAEFGRVQTSQGPASFTEWKVKRDAAQWIVIEAEIDPAFYMLYGNKTADELRYWAINLGIEMRRMLPGVPIEFTVKYAQTFNAEPRGLAPGDVTNLGSGRWRVDYTVIHLQYMDKLHVKVNT